MTDPPLLNEPQRNRFAVLLAALETALDDVERLAGGRAAAGQHLALLADDVSDTTAAVVREDIAAVRAQVRALATLLGIAPRTRSRARVMRAIILAQMLRVEDSYAAKLGGYGAVNARAAEVLDPPLRALHASLDRLARALAPAPANSEARAQGKQFAGPENTQVHPDE